MGQNRQQWDFFLAHAASDQNAAEILYSSLCKDFRVFLDTHSILPGDDWDIVLASAQKESLITVVLISSHTNAAYYQREEIATAIDMARGGKYSHRVVPVFLDEHVMKDGDVPYGLRLKHSISVDKVGGLDNTARILTNSLSSTLAMSKERILERHKDKAVIQRAIRLIPTNDFCADGLLGKPGQDYVFIGDYDEQRYRTLRQILSNLLIGDSFEAIPSSDVQRTAVTFEVGEYNYRKFDIKPATWKAAFRILSDTRRLARFAASEEENAEMGRGEKDYYSDDQSYWYGQLTIPERRYTSCGFDYFIYELGINNLCFSGHGLTWGATPSRIFFMKNTPLAVLKHRIYHLGLPGDNEMVP